MLEAIFEFNRDIIVRARPTTVWRFFAEPELFARWWGPGSSIEARVGAPVRIVYPDASTASGEVLAVEPGRLIRFGFGYDAPDKPIRPGGSQVTVTLEPVAEGTRVELRHQLADQALVDLHAAGWRYHLAVLAREVHAVQRGDVETTVDAYFRAWTDLTFEARATVLAGAVSRDVRFADAMGYTSGVVDLERHIVAARAHMPGIELRRRGPIRASQAVVLADWELRGAERVLAEGTNVFELDADGLIDSITGVTGIGITASS
jgi:uncharacterized protein YndB with AHSA1/START domain